MKQKKKILLTNWRIILVVLISLVFIFPNIPYWQIIGALLFIHQLLSLFQDAGERMPIRSMFGTLFCLQFLIGPAIAYDFGDSYVIEIYKMRIPQTEYYSYVLPVAIAFLLGLNIKNKNHEGESIDVDAIKQLRKRQPLLPHILIGIGFATGALEFFVPSDLRFVFYLLGALKYVGLFILVLSDKKLNFWAVILVVGYMVGVAVQTGMFHDLLTWTMFLGSILLIKYKLKPLVKLAVFVIFGFLATTIQFIKSDYRQTLSFNDDVGVETFGTVYNETSKEKGSMFSEQNIALNSVRINQGYIISHIMSNVPYNEPYSEGETLKQVFLSALVPRFLYPDKLNAGDQQIFMKYTGLQLNSTTAMALSSVGDAYINFGRAGGILFMFLYGFFFNGVLRWLGKQSKRLPVLALFVPMIFIFPIRPDCEMQTILGHLIKSTFLVVTVLYFFRRKFVSEPVWTTA